MAINYTLSPSPWQTFLDINGAPIANGRLFTYAAGTTTPAATYITSNGTPNANPIQLDGAGRATIFLAPGSYRFDLYSAPLTSDPTSGGLVKTQDNISAVPNTATQTANDGVAGVNLTAGQCVYLSDGSGGNMAGRWYPAKADQTYSSTLPEIGFVVADIASGQTGSIAQIGRITTGLTVTVGLSYYVDASTAGAITATAPANTRFVGQADSGTSLIISPDPPPSLNTVDNAIVDGRLTLTTGVPVTSTDVTGATVVFWAPFKGNRVALYNGTAWNIRTFVQSSIAVPSTTASLYDVFLFDNLGTPTLELSAAWTSDTAIFGSGTYAATRPTQDGVFVKSTNGTAIDATRRYVGTFRTTGSSGQTEDSAKKRYLWNYYNRVTRSLQNATETTDTWSYTTLTWRQANTNVANQLDVVIGMPEVTVMATVNGFGANNPGGAVLYAGIGADVTNAIATNCLPGQVATQNSVGVTVMASLTVQPAIGRHFYAWLEASQAAGATTWGGDNGTPLFVQAGITGTLSGA